MDARTPRKYSRETTPYSVCSRLSILTELSSKRGSRKQMDHTVWKVPYIPWISRLPSRKVNLLDLRTIYSEKQNKLLQTLESEKVIFPPVESSLGMKINQPDANLVKEKAIVLQDYEHLREHDKKEYHPSLGPSIRVDYVESPVSVESALDQNAEFLTAANVATKHSFHQDDRWRCQFCDVMKREYCAECIAFKQRQNAWRQNKCFLPTIKKRNPKEVPESDNKKKRVKRIIINLNFWP